MPPRPVVAAAIVDSLQRPSRLLAAQRSYPPELAGLFELPGGKVERGEAPLDALHREIHEELGTALTLGPPVPYPGHDQRASSSSHRHQGEEDLLRSAISAQATPENGAPAPSAEPDFSPWPILGGRVMWVWLAEVAPRAPVPVAHRDHQALVWTRLRDTPNLPWLPTNLPIVEQIRAQLPSHSRTPNTGGGETR